MNVAFAYAIYKRD